MTPFQGYDLLGRPETQGCTLGYRITPIRGYRQCATLIRPDA